MGMRNGKTTVVQAVSLKAPLDVAMGRAALVEARVADATQAMFRDHLPWTCSHDRGSPALLIPLANSGSGRGENRSGRTMGDWPYIAVVFSHPKEPPHVPPSPRCSLDS